MPLANAPPPDPRAPGSGSTGSSSTGARVANKRRRDTRTDTDEGAARVGRAPGSSSQLQSEPRPNPIAYEDLFTDPEDDGVEIIDLTKIDDPPAKDDDADAAAEQPAPAPPKPQASNVIKLGAQTCPICMDDITNMTVTHCGHIFCGQCLHDALQMADRTPFCPICRTKLEIRTANMTATKASRSYFPLVFKVRKATPKAEPPAG